MRILFLAALLAIGCASAPTQKPLMHDASGCSAICPSATTVEISARGDMCRCSNAVYGYQYTFKFPGNADEFAYACNRWSAGLNGAMDCRKQGMDWEPDAGGNTVQCVQPTEPQKA